MKHTSRERIRSHWFHRFNLAYPAARRNEVCKKLLLPSPRNRPLVFIHKAILYISFSITTMNDLPRIPARRKVNPDFETHRLLQLSGRRSWVNYERTPRMLLRWGREVAEDSVENTSYVEELNLFDWGFFWRFFAKHRKAEFQCREITNSLRIPVRFRNSREKKINKNFFFKM